MTSGSASLATRGGVDCGDAAPPGRLLDRVERGRQITVHIVTTEDMARVVGKPTLPEGAPVQVTFAPARLQTELRSICGFVVGDERGIHSDAISLRAVRAEPGRFELWPMCASCVSWFAIETAH